MNRLAVVLVLLISASTLSLAAGQRDRAYWQAIKTKSFEVPAGRAAESSAET